jgi:flavin reductase (DIM6/NTAB) family NADH-FMN oxidoreductase RutF
MNKVKLDRPVGLYPMPVTVVGAVVDGTVNYLAVSWIAPCNYEPRMVVAALGHDHHTNRGILEHGEFGLSLPGRDLMVAVDYVGLVSGKKHDKSQVFETFYGELAHAPMIRECRLVQTVALPGDTLFIGEVVAAYANAECLTDGAPDVRKIAPFVLTMPDNQYWSLGEPIGRAWSVGRAFKKTR